MEHQVKHLDPPNIFFPKNGYTLGNQQDNRSQYRQYRQPEKAFYDLLVKTELEIPGTQEKVLQSEKNNQQVQATLIVRRPYADHFMLVL